MMVLYINLNKNTPFRLNVTIIQVKKLKYYSFHKNLTILNP